MHTPRIDDPFKGFAAAVRRSVFSLGVIPTFLLIPSPEANEKYTRNFPPFFYRCDNGQTLVSRLEYENQFGDGEVLSVYPYPVEERSQVLWRSAGRQYIAVGGQQYDCKPWRRGDDGSGPVWGIPDPAGLKEYAKRFTPHSRYTCGGHTVSFRITDFVDAEDHHGVMKVNDQEEVGLYWTRGTSGNFNGKGSREPGIAFAWGVHAVDAKRSEIRWFLNIDDQTFTCNRGGY